MNDNLKLSNPCSICKKDIYLSQDLASINKVYVHTTCLLKQNSIKMLEIGKSEASKEVEKIIDDCSIPVIYEEEELDKFIKEHEEDKFRVLDYDKLKQQLQKLGEGK